MRFLKATCLVKKRNKLPGIKNKLQDNIVITVMPPNLQQVFSITFFYSRRCELLCSYEYQHGRIPSIEQSQKGMLFAPMVTVLKVGSSLPLRYVGVFY